MKRIVIDDQYVEQEFLRIASEIVSEDKNANLSFILEGLCGKDVSKIDMGNLSPANFRRLTFDSETIFSDEQIKKFHPEKLLERGKSFSRGMERLHAKGIDGKGTTIGIIDSCFDSSIAEFDSRVVQHLVFEKENGKDFVFYREYREEDGDGFHGKTTASLAAGNECGVAPNARMYLFGIAEGTSWGEAKEAILKYIIDNNIELDIISMSADIETSKEGQEILDKLEDKGCTFLDSSKFWKDFSWGRPSDDGKVVLIDELMKTMSNMQYDENSRSGKVLKNMPNTVILPCTERTSLQIGKKKGYKYNGSVCGASFAIPQIAGLFAIARQIDPLILYNEFIEIVKNPERLNSEGMMYVDSEEIVKKIQERSKTKGEILEETESLKNTQTLGRETLEEQRDTSEKLVVVQDMAQQIKDLENEQEKGK